MSESIIINVDLRGSSVAIKQLRKMGVNAKRSEGGVLGLKRALTALAFGGLTRQVVKLADSFTLLGNRVRVYTKDQSQANAVTNELINIANKNRVATDALALTYQRVTIQADSLGLSQKEVIRLTDILSKSVQIGGSTAQEAAGSLRQFSQALGTDFKASAQELNSVLEGTPGLADAIARGLGIQTKELKIFAAEGRLSAKLVVDGLLLQGDNVDKLFTRIRRTIGQALIVANNSLSVFVGKVFTVSGATKLFADFIIDVSIALKDFSLDTDRLRKFLDGVGDALRFIIATGAVVFFKNLAVSMALAAKAGRGLSFALLGLSPTTALIAGVATGLFLVRDATVSVNGEMVTLEDLAVGTFEELSKSLLGINLDFDEIINGGLSNFILAFANAPIQITEAFIVGFTGLFAFVVGFLVDLVNGIGKASGTIAGLLLDAFTFKEVDAKTALALLSEDLKLSFAPAIASATLQGIKDALTKNSLGDLADALAIVISDTDIGDRATERANRRAAGPAAAGPLGDDGGLDDDKNVRDQIDNTVAALERLRASLSPAAQAALDFAEAQKTVFEATKEGTAARVEGLKILDEFKRRAFDDVASSIDPVLKLTREYTDELGLLRETYSRLGDEGRLAEFEELQAKLAEDFQRAKVNLEEYNETLGDVEAFQLGVTEGIQRFAESLGSTFDIVASSISGFLNLGIDAITKFVQTGKFSFREFAADVIKQLQKVIIKLLIVKLLKAALSLGGGGDAGGGNVGGAFQLDTGGAVSGADLSNFAAGGAIQKGQASIVGEQGPELFVPPTNGQIVPNGAMGATPIVNVINVTDPSEIPSGMATKEGETVIMNVLRRNRSILREISA